MNGDREMTEGAAGLSLQNWLAQAVQALAKASAARVRVEIEQHYEQAREESLSSGASEEDASRRALASLGSAKAANRAYRRVLLTQSDEAVLASMREQDKRSPRFWRILTWVLFAVDLALFAGGLAALGRLGFWSGFLFGLGAGLGVGWLVQPNYARGRERTLHTVCRACIPLVTIWALHMVVPWVLVALYGGGAAAAWLWPFWIRGLLRRKLPETEWPEQIAR